ncbi:MULTISPECIES: flagellar basal body rod protein FlgC [Eubacteriales]|uniref:flagellar basal body rod protein FlgC n=1 Tax=Eubacteriales TaxID=186802 RepID=UPI000557D203|nr:MULTISPECIES: flagellar basal body rod protein FlgC [Eubacteriales]MBE6743515.1 flagellar basal body rod protein FlgC [Oscillospiraceae bacterium]MBS5781913.1 flagellar basal body rod protein FlgC [Clostridium sp.]MDU6305357.1 flagellar basal body rod protein FlgC [Clostridium sp.]MDU6347240.1 flagellar basal body rod protein FlgC [Clostridium sp.]
MAFLSSLDISASALTAERFRMDVISENMANSSTTRTENGGSYRRKLVVLQTQGEDQSRFRRIFQNQLQQVGQGVQVAQVAEDPSDLTPVYDPTHPDANADGYVMMPNVDPVKETVDMMAATRAYEANLTMFNAVKNMAVKALEMGR